MKLRYLALTILPLTISVCQADDTTIFDEKYISSILGSYDWSYVLKGSPKPIILSFNEKKLYIDTGCNHQKASWSIEKNLLNVDRIGGTLKICSSKLMQQEKFAKELLDRKGINFTINKKNLEKPSLTLITQTGDKIVFTGKMTPEKRYQSKAETIFFEVNTKTKPCTGSAIQQKCFQIRKVKYSNNGVKTLVDKDWTYFYDSIEGFTHNPKVRQIIRVKRYTIKSPTADQSRYAYILDLVVESEEIK